MESQHDRTGAARMTIPSQQGVTLPAIADAGTITIPALSKTVTGNATTLAAVTIGQAIILPGVADIKIAATIPVNLGGGVCTFDLLYTETNAYTGKAWALADNPSDDEAAIIMQQDDIGNTAGRAAHNAAANGYCYLDATTAIMWERNGPAGNWTNRCTTAVLWVSTAGSDTDPDNPERATIQAAIDELSRAGDLSGWNVIIAIKAGTYTAPIVLKEIAGAPTLLKICGEASLTGTPASLSSYVISSASPIAAIQATNLKDAWTLEGFTLTASKGHLLQAKGARLRFNQLRFGAAPGAHIAALSAGSIVLAGNGYEIAGGANAHLLANGSGATVDLQAEATVTAPTVTISAASAFKTAYAWARASGHIFTGTGLIFVTKSNATGRRWRAEQNSSIDSGQSGEKYLPGTAGTAGNGVAVKNGEYI
jgi:hypothetical protein